MAIAWAAKRKLAVFGIFSFIILIVVLWVVYSFQGEESCFDKEQNQDEEGIDCGGSFCAPCEASIKDLTLLWSRFFVIKDGVATVAAFFENSNQFLRSSEFTYSIKLYDKENILIAVRENTTYIEPSSRFVIFEPNIETGARVAGHAIVEIRSVKWDVGRPRVLQIVVENKDLLLDDFPSRLEIRVHNESGLTYNNVEAVAVLFGANEDVRGVSRTIIESFGIDESRNLVFTWPDKVEGVDRSEIFFRSEL
jgi:hypothetical protein